MEELACYLFYDIESDQVRAKVSETCKDLGLERIQFSGFFGYLNQNRREELLLRLTALLEAKKGKVLLQPVCDKDFKKRRQIIQEEDTTLAKPDSE